LVYGYIRFWDLAAVTYYGHTPSVGEAFNMLSQQTPYTFSFWVFEIILGIFLPAVLFLTPRFNRNPAYLVIGAFFAVLGILVNRWNVTVGGLFVPLSYSPGTLYQLPPGKYFPGLPEWGIAIGIIGYALTMLTLGVRYLPLFGKEGHS
jgi:molybdopterin-containing oxidoreductase family membrane subunit